LSSGAFAGVGAARDIMPYDAMDDPSPYRVIVHARPKPGVGYTFIITRKDLTEWSHGTMTFYATPEAASEAGRIALEAFVARQK
jgi:hypothetical protein